MTLRLQDRILSALQWAGRAAVEERREEAFLLYAIAIESLLLGGKSHVEVTERLAVRGAHLLSGDPKARENVRIVTFRASPELRTNRYRSPAATDSGRPRLEPARSRTQS